MGKRVCEYRIRRIGVGKYQVEERHRFMYFWAFWVKGSIRFPQLRETFETARQAAEAIMKAAREQRIDVYIEDLEAIFLNIQRSVKGQVRAARRQARKADERARNLRRIRRETEE